MRTLVLAVAASAATLAFLHPVTPFAAAGPSVARAPDDLTLPAPKAGRARPLVVVLADNAGAETTDFAIPYGVLKRSGVAEVRSVATGQGPIKLMPSLKILADQTVAQFDRAEPAGADIIIVPAQMKPKSPALAAWLRAQAGKGAVIMSICEGARVLANAGLLHDRRATTHWSALKGLAKAYPDTTWVRDRRYVQDGPIISTTGVSASLPASLALVEAIAGRATAQATADRIGVRDWSAAHRTGDFQVTAADYRQLALDTPAVEVGRVEVLPRFKPRDRRFEVPGVVSVMALPARAFDPAANPGPQPRPDRPLHRHVARPYRWPLPAR